jgi:phosphoenolpyruvate carboxykinase (GTP)
MRNETLETWILLATAHTTPARIHWCDGSEAELKELRDQLQATGILQRLNERTHPGCFVYRSESSDALRVDRRRFVCTPRQGDVGPTNQWLPEEEAYRSIWPLFAKAMTGRTLYVVPYLLGSPRSKYAQVGVQLTDSPWVVLLMHTLTRVGRVALEHLGRSSEFARGLHCLDGCRPERRFVVEFPATQTWWSIGTAHPESSTMIKSHALGLVGNLAPEEGYLAEHMSVARITDPAGLVLYVAAAFPSGCGKTRFATLSPSLPGYRVAMVADGMALLRVGDDGRLWALNSAAGIDGMIGEGQRRAAPSGWARRARNVIFTNVGLCSDGSPWWESGGKPYRPEVRDWRGRAWRPGTDAPAAHPNARFIMAARDFPGLSSDFDAPGGVPLSAIFFGGRRSTLVPLIVEANSWEHGVYMAATSRSEPAPGFTESRRVFLRNDPMGMLPFCSYNMADHFRHWLSLGRQLRRRPRIFHVNWFRRDESGRLLWPGFGHNVRVLDWALKRVQRSVDAQSTPIGWIPRSLDMSGLDLDSDALDRLLQVDVGGWLGEAEANGTFLARFGERLPPDLHGQQRALLSRLRAATN